ncbi:MAG: hypothetical protein FJ288_06280 [Planctomycetes bacterium]|nr:hypothetical protein [Planctomycetota bacterium]
MSILFRCPCGRSMVAEDDRAGAVVMCPNCRRSLKVPSGKDRGVQISSAPAATKVRTSRLCQRCRKEVSVDSQMCPHCKAILLDAAPVAAAAPAAKAVPVARPAQIAGAGGQPLLYGGARASWFSRLTPGGKAGAIGGAAGFVLVLVLIGCFIYSAWYSGQVTEARETAQKAVSQGRKLENLGKYQDAYELYWVALNYEDYLRDTREARDADLVDAVKARITAFQYLVAQPKVKGSVYWRPKNQQEYDQAMSDLRRNYQTYKEWLSVVADAGLAAAQFALANPANQAAFDGEVGKAMDAYVKFISQTTEQQRAQRTFQQLIEGLRSLCGANRNWAKPAERENYLKNTEGYLNAAKDFASRGDDDLWGR